MPTPIVDSPHTISAEQAVRVATRDIRLGTLARVTGIVAALAILSAELFGLLPTRGTGLFILGMLWIALAVRSVRGMRLLTGVGVLIELGDYASAEPRVTAALRGFSILRVPKLRALEHLALLRHAQGRFRDSATLSRAALHLGGGRPDGLALRRGGAFELILAEASLESNDLPTTYEMLSRLACQPLGPRDTIKRLQIELDYGARVRAWDAMLLHVSDKVLRLESLPARFSARSHALLALAARKTGRVALAEWLKRRALLLVDADRLITERPLLGDVLKATDG